MAIDSACSSSLVALHQARRALQLRECELAVVAGVNTLDPQSSLACALASMTAADGQGRTFDAAADGYSRAEGCVAVVLKPLTRAVADGDRIHAVIRGSAVMQDGKSASLTAPNALMQQRVLQRALDDAGVSPNEVHLLETHGTGTQLGDPIEVSAPCHSSNGI